MRLQQDPEKTSRKQRRQLLLKQQFESTLTSSDTENDSDSLTYIHLPTHHYSMAQPTRLLVCSIGNPGPYLNTLHSAGHTVLNILASSLSYPSFRKSSIHGNGLISAGSDFTLWQSSSLMNVSGTGVSRAWKQFLSESHGQETRLVIVHDELEAGVGQVKVKSGTASARGHNGLKSINENMRGQEYVRIGVGIGRPESREKDAVSQFVLRKMSPFERAKIEGAVGKVEAELRRLSGS